MKCNPSRPSVLFILSPWDMKDAQKRKEKKAKKGKFTREKIKGLCWLRPRVHPLVGSPFSVYALFNVVVVR